MRSFSTCVRWTCVFLAKYHDCAQVCAYICMMVLCISRVGHVSPSMCMILYIESLMLCNKNFCGMLCTVYSCKLEYT